MSSNLNFKKSAAIIFIIAILLAGLCPGFKVNQAFAEKVTRYKITVNVDTPEGIKTGSSVLEFTSSENLIVLPEGRKYSETMRGEAVVVDLPNNQTLFVLLRQDGGRSIGELIGRTLYPNGRKENEPERKVGDPPVHMNRYLKIGNKKLNEAGIPMMVRFKDINDPKSVEKVDPDNLEASFGKGTKLKSVTVEVTQMGPSIGIKKKLKWLSDGGLTLDPDSGPTISPNLAQTIHQYLFTTEINK